VAILVDKKEDVAKFKDFKLDGGEAKAAPAAPKKQEAPAAA
jgi:hypothetical protein